MVRKRKEKKAKSKEEKPTKKEGKKAPKPNGMIFKVG
jgi:hypothetical protein